MAFSQPPIVPVLLKGGSSDGLRVAAMEILDLAGGRTYLRTPSTPTSVDLNEYEFLEVADSGDRVLIRRGTRS